MAPKQRHADPERGPAPQVRTHRASWYLAGAATAVSVLMSCGFALAGLFAPAAIAPAGASLGAASALFAQYAAARSVPIALVTLWALRGGSAAALAALAALAGLMQGLDGIVGLLQHDPGKTIGPACLALLQIFAVRVFARAAAAPDANPR